jgi:hypothetical protein
MHADGRPSAVQCNGTLIAGVPVALCSGVTDRYSVTRSAKV